MRIIEELFNVTDPTGRDLRLGKPHPCNLIHFDANPAPAFAPFGQRNGRPAPSSLMNPKPAEWIGGQRQVSLDGLPSWQMGCRHPAARRNQHQSKVEQTTVASFNCLIIRFLGSLTQELTFRPSRK
jgi:hypothetical protein